MCYTPENIAGDCRSIYDCPSILSQIQGRITRLTADYLRSLHCENGNGLFPYVCCVIRINEFGVQWPQLLQPSQPPSVQNQFTTTATHLSPTNTQTSVTNPSLPHHRRTHQRKTPNGAQLPGAGVCGLTSLAHRIFGGEETAIDEYPWLVLLEYNSIRKYKLTVHCGDQHVAAIDLPLEIFVKENLWARERDEMNRDEFFLSKFNTATAFVDWIHFK